MEVGKKSDLWGRLTGYFAAMIAEVEGGEEAEAVH
jgi:hypothetical protein